MLFNILYFLKTIGWPARLFLIVLLVAIVLMVINCGGDKTIEPTTTPATSTPPPHLSNEVPDEEQLQQWKVDSLNAVKP